jgi:hypothetical protein
VLGFILFTLEFGLKLWTCVEDPILSTPPPRVNPLLASSLQRRHRAITTIDGRPPAVTSIVFEAPLIDESNDNNANDGTIERPAPLDVGIAITSDSSVGAVVPASPTSYGATQSPEALSPPNGNVLPSSALSSSLPPPAIDNDSEKKDTNAALSNDDDEDEDDMVAPPAVPLSPWRIRLRWLLQALTIIDLVQPLFAYFPLVACHSQRIRVHANRLSC